MTLSRKRPLPAHTWPQGIDAGPPQTCETCHAEWREGYEDPPPWKCKTGGLKRTSGPAPVSETNSGREHQRDEAYREYVRGLPCCACGREPPSDSHHVRNWGAGHGDWLPGGTGNLAPLCRMCHDALDDVGGGKQTFEDYWEIDLAAEAARIGERYREAGT